ncbi:MAG: hypothetical protein V7745_04035 [Pseudomonadales bacterium]
MLTLKSKTWPQLLSLALAISFFAAYAGSSVAAESTVSYYEQLEALSSGEKELSSVVRETLEATAYDPREGLGGVKLGMSMEDVIGIWGYPKSICQRATTNVLSIGRGSKFSFVQNELVKVSIHSADLPSMKLSNGVDFSFSPSQLSSFYTIRNPSGNRYVADLTEGIEMQFLYSNIGNKGLRLITMAIIRRP